jgi:murein DD-endopeptidase MepM/ murein hydrolase activator NlpD
VNRIRYLLILFALLILLPLPSQEAQAQCQIRTDWPTYTVVRGDTLARIARRYGISMYQLGNANCIYNLNLIYRGQTLRVPPTGAPTIPNLPTIPSNPPGSSATGSFQTYENGLMIWRSDSSDIWVLDNSGFASRYPAAYYGFLPASFDVGPTPAGRIRPILGFGRVWGNLADVRSRLGWAVDAEQGATITSQVGSALLVTLTPGRGQLTIYPASSTWSYATGTPPIVTPVPPPISPQILAFNASPTTVLVGQNVTLNWNVQGVQGVIIEINNAVTSPDPEVVLSYLPVSGSTAFTVPGDYRGIWFTLYGVNYAANGAVIRVISSSIFVAVNAPTTNTTVYAAYQPYDNGFMIWRSDTGDIFVFYSFGAVNVFPVTYYGSFPENPVTTPVPPGRVRPISGFGRLWGSQPYFMTQLGWATAPEQGYSMLVESLPDGRTRFTLPSGNTATFANGVWSG